MYHQNHLVSEHQAAPKRPSRHNNQHGQNNLRTRDSGEYQQRGGNPAGYSHQGQMNGFNNKQSTKHNNIHTYGGGGQNYSANVYPPAPVGGHYLAAPPSSNERQPSERRRFNLKSAVTSLFFPNSVSMAMKGSSSTLNATGTTSGGGVAAGAGGPTPLLKVIMVGSGGVGKSALTLQFMYDEVS